MKKKVSLLIMVAFAVLSVNAVVVSADGQSTGTTKVVSGGIVTFGHGVDR